MKGETPVWTAEADLVEALEGAIRGKEGRYPQCRLRVFREFDAGFGRVDLLSVWYCPLSFDKRAERTTMTDRLFGKFGIMDGFAMSYIEQQRWIDRAQLPEFLRVPRRRAERLLESLSERGLVEIVRDRVRVRPVKDVWAVRAIEAFEAKLDKWEKVAEQACRHRWFATQSFVVMPNAGRDVGERIRTACGEWRLGLWLFTDREKSTLSMPAARGTPRTQISWWLNEFLFEEHRRDAV